MLIKHQNYGTAPYNHNLMYAYDYNSVLIENIALYDGISVLVDELKIITGNVSVFGTTKQSHIISKGRLFEKCDKRSISPMFDENAIVDLASVTKIFTIVAIMQLYENGKLCFDTKVSQYLPQYKNIGDITVYDLLRFRYDFQTDYRIDKCVTKDEAFCCLHNIHISFSNTIHTYNDFSAIIASELVEKISGISFKDYIFENILNKCGMEDTGTRLTNDQLEKVACTDYEYRLTENNTFIEKRTLLGQINDEKARILSLDGKNLTGHAGLFSTAKDMALFCNSLLSNALLSQNSLNLIGSLHTGVFNSGKASQHLGLLCNSKSPIERESGSYKGLSGNTIAISGYTGTHLMIDPLNQIYCFIASNRINNRLTRLPSYMDSGLRTMYCPLDNTDKIISQNYVFLKDIYLRNPISKVLLQIRFKEHKNKVE